MQVKSVLTLAAVVVVITAVAGWSYYAVIERWLSESRRCHVRVLTESLARSALDPLRDGDADALNRLAADFVFTDGVRHVAVLNADGRVVARASRAGDRPWPTVVNWPLAISETQRVGKDMFALARPVVDEPGRGRTGGLIGSVRLVVDTTPLAASLAEVRIAMGLIAAALVVFGVPLGYLLVWRVLVQPVRRLVSATSQLAAGDYSARVNIDRRDEIGELALAFDGMVDEVSRSHAALVRANEDLEAQVRRRTAELQRVNRRLRDEAAEKEDFLRAVSHDLNAPLRNISGLAGSVLRRWSGMLPVEVLDRLDRVRANVTLATDMLEDLLELSRVKTRPQQREPTDMHALVREVADAFDFALSAGGIELTISEPMPTLWVERRRLRQVFQNLIDNAIKYMHRSRGGRIEVGYRLDDGRHVFHVADNGPGLPNDQQQSVFCVFRRAPSPATARVEGKGVGLALVKAVASNYEGEAWVESAEGEGATFCLALSVDATGAAAGGVEPSGESRGDLVSAGAPAADGQEGS
jgi:signal transduction histidine kinase